MGMRGGRGGYFRLKTQQEPRHGSRKTKQTPSSDDCEISLLAVGTEYIFGITAGCEEHNTHRGGRLASRGIKLVSDLKKSYITLHPRTEGNNCQLDRFVIRIKCDNIYVRVLKNIRHFINRKRLLLLVGAWAKKEQLCSGHDVLRGQCAVTSKGPRRSWI